MVGKGELIESIGFRDFKTKNLPASPTLNVFLVLQL